MKSKAKLWVKSSVRHTDEIFSLRTKVKDAIMPFGNGVFCYRYDFSNCDFPLCKILHSAFCLFQCFTWNIEIWIFKNHKFWNSKNWKNTIKNACQNRIILLINVYWIAEKNKIAGNEWSKRLKVSNIKGFGRFLWFVEIILFLPSGGVGNLKITNFSKIYKNHHFSS